jgi:hypothetical protein
MDLELKKALVASCGRELGVSIGTFANCSVKHLRALKTARGAAMVYRSKSVLKEMGYSDPDLEGISKNLPGL